MSKLYYRFDEICPTEEVGGKSAMLSVMTRMDAPIPGGLALSAELERKFLKDCGMTDDEIEHGLKCEEDYLHILRDKIANAKWQESTLSCLREIYAALSEGAVCVRSSAINEDGTINSFAGVFRSVINVRTFGEFLYAVRDCWMSGVEDNAVRYARKVGCQLTLMAETVQSLIYSVAAGVATIESDVITISAARGQGTGVVSGRIECDTYKIDRNNTPIDEIVVRKESAILANLNDYPICFFETEYPWINGSFKRFYVYSDDERSALLKGKFIESEEERSAPVLDTEKRTELARLCFDVTENVNSEQNWDLEWCMDAEGKLYLTQLRPLLSVMQSKEQRIIHSENMVASGVPISIGKSSGRCVIVYSSEDYDKVKEGDVVYLNEVMDTFVQILSKISALILGPEASSLSHCAIIAREWEVPCVGGIERNLLKEYEIYTVDGTNGVIYEADSGCVSDPSTKNKNNEEKTTAIPLLPYLLVAFENIASGISTIEEETAIWRNCVLSYPELEKISCKGIAEINYDDSMLQNMFVSMRDNMLSVLPENIKAEDNL